MIVKGIKQKYILCLGKLSESKNFKTIRMPKNKENMTNMIFTNQCKLRMSIVKYVSYRGTKKSKSIYVIMSVE